MRPAPLDGSKAHRIYLLLREEISNGSFAVGALLPGENRLADTFDVSRVTIRRALSALAEEGWIEKRLGAGSIVLARGDKTPPVSADFANPFPQIVEMDRASTAKLLSFGYTTPPMAVAKDLKMPANARVQKAVRVRSSGNRPFSHLTTYVPEAIARSYDEADLATQPLFRLLERSGVQIERAQQSVTAALATPDVADALGVSVGSPLLSLKRAVFDAQGHGVEYLAALYRADLFRLEMALSRVGAGEERHWEPVIGECSA